MASDSGAATTEPSIRKLIVRPSITGSVFPWTQAMTTMLTQPFMAPMPNRMTPATGSDGARPMAASPIPMISTNARTIAPNRRGCGSDPAAITPTSEPAPNAANTRPRAAASAPNRTRTSHGRPTTVAPVKARFAAVDRTTIERMTGSPRTTRPPSTSDARIDWAWGGGSGSGAASGGAPSSDPRPAVAPERTNQSISAATANDAASTAKAAPTPTSATENPATAGPIVPTSWPVPWSIALAAARRSDGTRRGTSVLIAGRNTASTVPNTTPTAARCHSSTRSPMTRAATIVVRIARSTFEARARSRGEIRSDRTPPTSRNTPRGIAAAIRMAPRAKPEPVSPSTSQARATVLNWSPRSEMLSPSQTKR